MENNKGIVVGQTYKDLRVDEVDSIRNNRKYYKCTCIKCNTQVVMRSDSIKRYGHSSNCKCDYHYNRANKKDIDKVKEDLSGRIFGELEVLLLDHINNASNSIWKCKCYHCGNEVLMKRYELISGKYTMCKQCTVASKIGNSNLVDYSGKIVGDLYIISRDKDEESKHTYRCTYWKCRCLMCNNIVSIPAPTLSDPNTKKRCPKCAKIKHGMRNTTFYDVWSNIIQRCTNPNNPKYKDYGARGITVCDRWRSFDNFKIDMYDSYIEYKKTHPEEYISLDRIDNNKGYSKDNCRWAGRYEQQNNTRLNTRYHIAGGDFTVREIMDMSIADSDRTYDAIKSAINVSGKSIEEAIRSPLRKEAKPAVHFDNDNI